MSTLQLIVMALLAAVLLFVPAIFLRMAAKFLRIPVSQQFAYLLTLACCLPGLGVILLVRELHFPWASAIGLVGVLVVVPGFAYGRFLKSAEGQAIGAFNGFKVVVLQLLLMVVLAAAIAFVVAFLRAPR
jgi:hypothetical protein